MSPDSIARRRPDPLPWGWEVPLGAGFAWLSLAAAGDAVRAHTPVSTKPPSGWTLSAQLISMPTRLTPTMGCRCPALRSKAFSWPSADASDCDDLVGPASHRAQSHRDSGTCGVDEPERAAGVEPGDHGDVAGVGRGALGAGDQDEVAGTGVLDGDLVLI